MSVSVSRYKSYLPFLLVIPIYLVIFLMQLHIKGYKGVEAKIEELMRLPGGKYLKPVVLEYEQLVGDIIWLRTIQVLGDRVVTPKGYEWAYHALDVVTTLDPKFAYAYQLGAINLSVLGSRPDLGNLLLEKGIRENQDVWELPFYLGFNKFFYFNDYKSAAEYMAMASKLPGHPSYLPKLAARLYVQAGNPDVALDFLKKIYNKTEDERVKESLERRMKEVIIERDARYLESAIAVYQKIYGNTPQSLTELAEKGIISEIPREPFGGYYYINRNDGRVYSSNIRDRMRVYGKDR